MKEAEGSEILPTIVSMKMPFGKYKGRLLCDLPVEYLEWFARKGFPPGKMGIYMGIFNFFITLPQILNGIVGGPMVKNVYNNQPVYALVLSGIFMLCAAVSVIYVYDPGAIKIAEEKNG